MNVLAGISLVLLIALGLAGYQLKEAHQSIGEFSFAMEHAKQTAESNQRVYTMALSAKNTEIEGLTRARELSEAAVMQSITKETAARQHAETLERSLREAVANDEKSSEWASVRVPDAVIDGMRNAAAASTGADR